MAGTNHSSEMKMYDAVDSTLTVNNQVIWGFQPGEAMCTISWANNKVTESPDSMGTVVFSRVNKNDGTITVNLSEMSPCNKILSDLSDNNTRFPVDFSNTADHVWAQDAYIAKIPDISDGDTASGRSYQIKAANLLHESNL